jgi:hypothetical protein
MTMQYKYAIHLADNGEPAVSLHIKKERIIAVKHGEVSVLRKATLQGLPEGEAHLWLNMINDLEAMLGKIKDVPLSSIVGLESQWAPLDERFDDAFFGGIELNFSRFVRVFVEGELPNVSIVFSVGVSSARYTLHASQVPIARAELSDCEKIVQEVQNRGGGAAEVADALKAASEAGKTSIAVTECALKIAEAIASRGLGTALGALAACSSAVGSVQDLMEASAKDAAEREAAREKALRECREIRECPAGPARDRVIEAVEHMFDA